jgi:putative DNA primase/helicase
MSYDNIPEILKQQKQWVVWGVPGEFPKAPFQPDNLLKLSAVPAKSGVPDTWGSFETAALCAERGLAKGIGYEFDGRGIYGVDLDHVIENGIIAPQAREIVENLNSYTEISPSGRGLHIFVTADNPNITRHRKQGGFVEIYNTARYFTVTGNVYQGFLRIADRPVELQLIHDKYLLPEPTKQSTVHYSVETPQDTEHYLRRGLQKDVVLQAYWNGARRLGDESASDQALMNKLAYWCNANQPAMLAAFLQSPYYAQKDEPHKKKCQRSDYLPNTAKKACESLRSIAYEDTQRYRREREFER